MDEFEQELKKALAREDAPEWFEARVLAAAARRHETPRAWWGHWLAASRMRWATAMLATVTMVTGIAWQRERMAEQRGQQAKAQLELALRITGEKLQIIEQKIQQNN